MAPEPDRRTCEFFGRIFRSAGPLVDIQWKAPFSKAPEEVCNNEKSGETVSGLPLAHVVQLALVLPKGVRKVKHNLNVWKEGTVRCPP